MVNVYFTYKSIYGDVKHYLYDYGDDGFNEDYYDLNESERREMMENEIQAMVDDCEKIITWNISRIRIEDI